MANLALAGVDVMDDVAEDVAVSPDSGDSDSLGSRTLSADSPPGARDAAATAGTQPHDPFFFRGPADADACLLIHGSTGTAGDLRGLGEYLHGRGLTVRGISLPGHARRPARLEGVTWRTCYAEVHRAWREMDAASRTVHVLGFSYGGALALHLAAAEPIDDLVLLAPGLHIHLSARELLGAMLGLVPGTWMHTRLRWNLNLLGYFRMVRAELGRVRCPVLIMHARDDKLVRYQSSQEAFDQIASVERRLVLLDEGSHLLPWGPAHKRVWEEVAAHVMHFDASRHARI